MVLLARDWLWISSKCFSSAEIDEWFYMAWRVLHRYCFLFVLFGCVIVLSFTARKEKRKREGAQGVNGNKDPTTKLNEWVNVNFSLMELEKKIHSSLTRIADAGLSSIIIVIGLQPKEKSRFNQSQSASISFNDAQTVAISVCSWWITAISHAHITVNWFQFFGLE